MCPVKKKKFVLKLCYCYVNPYKLVFMAHCANRLLDVGKLCGRILLYNMCRRWITLCHPKNCQLVYDSAMRRSKLKTLCHFISMSFILSLKPNFYIQLSLLRSHTQVLTSQIVFNSQVNTVLFMTYFEGGVCHCP